ncbi:MAG: WecB/TagA/CpsF family glycosyltransferase [Thermoleophilia bacterium]
MSHPARLTLMGMAIDPITQAEAVGRIVGAIRQGHGGVVVTPNLDHLRLFTADPGVRDLYATADLVLADGMPLVWASRIAGDPLPERVAGSDLIWSLSQACAAADLSVFMLGGNPGAAEEAGRVLTERFPGLRVAGTLCPPMGFDADPAQMDAVRAALREAAPDVVYVGVSFPRSARVSEALRADLPAAWFLGLGVSLSFVSGEVARAPEWVQRTGLEWVFRIIQEPRRLLARYLVRGLPFAARLGASAALQRLRTR